ncbi:exosortase-associated protein EpsI, B-type [Duganella vulcania]|uniref:EpsI family protein n=1 Tax=Duganella vulcania TaxID=2692166 RepID=A0A845GVX5_9BURK|nr:exosortase-associated protein EpsI, B-type [Duganella vulcania]MYM98015.1 EpsI family protein [Duganella vulcania]
MEKKITLSLVLCLLMVSSAGLTRVVTPTRKMADHREKLQLETLIPQRFGDWQVDTSVVPLQVDPETQARLDRIYNQTLSRTYVNADGERVMLSMAYGGDQGDGMGVHRPEVCYASQGFEIKKDQFVNLGTSYGVLPVKQLLAVSGNRSEPITYWITIGDKMTRPDFQQRLQRLRYGLEGTVPDGMLVRVSTIDTDLPRAYGVQSRFVKALLDSLNTKDRARLIGTFTG